MSEARGAVAWGSGTRYERGDTRASRASRAARASLLLCSLLHGCSGDTPTGAIATPPAPALSAFTRVLDSLRTAYDLPALAGAIVTADSVLQLDVVGVRMVGNPRLVTRDDRFHLGSVFKHQVAVLVARLVAEGRLSWARTLAEYFPEEASTMRPEFRNATLRELLSHSTGLLRDPGIPNLPSDPRAARAATTKSVLQVPPVVAPGTYSYSNTAFIVVGAIIDRVMDQAFEQVAQERLWTPLGITTGGFGAPGSTAIDQPLGHVVNPDGARTSYLPTDPGADNPVAYSPAGRAHMSIGDWARFTRALLRAESGRDTPVLSSSAWKGLTTGFTPLSGTDSYGYGLGVVTRSWAGGRALSHSGSNLRNYAVTWIAPGRDVAFLLVTNQYSSIVGSQLDAAIGRLIGFWQNAR